MPSLDKYQDEHRLFLQGLMCKGVLNEKEVHKLHDKALNLCNISIPEKKSEKNGLLVENIKIINNELKKVGLLIRKGQDEDSGKSFFLLVNTQSRMTGNSRELATNVQSQWSTQELEYLRLIATEILESDKKEISSTAALRLTDKVDKKAGKKLSLEMAEETINSLMAAKWLKQTADSKLVLAVRFIGEMESWMVEVMGREGITYCQTCRKVVVRGGSCPCQPGVVWHFYCLDKQASKGAEIHCAVCGKKVIREGRTRKQHVDDEDEDEEGEDLSQRSKRKPSGRNVTRPSSQQVVKDVEDDEDETSLIPGTSRRSSDRGEPSKRSRRGSRRSCDMEIDDDDKEEEAEKPSQARRSRIKRRFSGEEDTDSD